MIIIRTLDELRVQLRMLRRDEARIGFVPTMGALHAGHISLIEAAKRVSEQVVVSIFVNPAQFGPNEDFDRYPRQEKEDLEMLRRAGVALAYLPSREALYPKGFSTTISVGPLAKELCGISRPKFFDGVALIVAKLLMQVRPNVILLGEKDYQQYLVVKRLVRDLDIHVHVVAAPTLREEDGLAMSSRNQYLSEAERAIAPGLHKVLQSIADLLEQGGETPDKLIAWGKQELKSLGFDRVDYLDIRTASGLVPVTSYNGKARVLGAAYLGKTRLIDNVPAG